MVPAPPTRTGAPRHGGVEQRGVLERYGWRRAVPSTSSHTAPCTNWIPPDHQPQAQRGGGSLERGEGEHGILL
eukprot:13418182-Alexandrium_andersonii.AAC.1